MKIGFYGLGPASFPYVNYSLARLNEIQLATVFPPLSSLRLYSICCLIEKKTEPLILFGYSRGAITALKLCKILSHRQKTIQFLYLIDPISYYRQRIWIPENVEQGFACFQRNGARTPFLFGQFGKGVREYLCKNPLKVRFETEQVRVLKNAQPAMHEDMVHYCFFEAKITLLSILRTAV
ncbi:thioesterase domain-containing protein [Methylacidiphilum caldifontis]|uniref:Alpha/beta hydrolase n=1 Tax=Methylacidiphilum caldifontis TaxID=2795386 RepID=A0A4Y8PCU8_9BACT|nr:thioesterase domain-containing protein [Methylacidiphilum caldifontis]QSR89009.1 alpha/beta hydrolase [Methylacidiphilum caldifontis]TFE68605.1 alpha/beta hydrolase [Methylacidiphilum caldifontis]